MTPYLPMNNIISRAIDCARSGKLSEARQMAESNLANFPEDAETWHLLGLLDNLGGSPASALGRFQRAIALSPNVAKYHSNYGNALLGLGHKLEAEGAYRHALELEPGHHSAAFNLASLLNTKARHEEALEVLAPFDDGRDTTGETDSLLGNLYQNTGQSDRALAHYQRAVTLNPDRAGFWAQLAVMQELVNRVEDARLSAERGMALSPDVPPLRLVQARLLRREKRFDEAIQAISSLDLAKVPDAIAAKLLNEWGTSLDRLDHPAEAMQKFVAAKQRQAQSLPDLSENAQKYMRRLEEALRLDYSSLARQDRFENDPEPVFLIGFPRSGTTLLDQILDSHPSIHTLEEKPLIVNLVDAHPEYFTPTNNRVVSLPPSARESLQRRYFELVAQHVTVTPGNILVDKLPLSITRVPQILQIFPRARFILALRHTCDVVLSTQMHLFEANAAMAHFQSLEGTAKLYAKVMQLWQRFNEDLHPSHHVIRYENVVGNFEAEIRGLLEYLNLPWDESMRKHTDHARNRGLINTPSYHQVAEPIYNRAAGRWVRYRQELEPVLPILEPAMCYLDYSATVD